MIFNVLFFVTLTTVFLCVRVIKDSEEACVKPSPEKVLIQKLPFP